MGYSRQNQTIIDILNQVLTAELTAINQYFVHAEMCENWGYNRLCEHIKKHSIGEMKHAEKLIERVLFLEGTPNVQRLGKINLGENIEEMLRSDLTLEKDALPRLADGITTCYDEGDHTSRGLLQEILADEEEHVDWLEAQLEQIEQMGIGNYLSVQVRD